MLIGPKVERWRELSDVYCYRGILCVTGDSSFVDQILEVRIKNRLECADGEKRPFHRIMIETSYMLSCTHSLKFKNMRGDSETFLTTEDCRYHTDNAQNQNQKSSLYDLYLLPY